MVEFCATLCGVMKIRGAVMHVSILQQKVSTSIQTGFWVRKSGKLLCSTLLSRYLGIDAEAATCVQKRIRICEWISKCRIHLGDTPKQKYQNTKTKCLWGRNTNPNFLDQIEISGVNLFNPILEKNLVYTSKSEAKTMGRN